MRIYRRQRNIMDESINITPMIDTVLILIIFLTLTTTFSKETHLTLTLPKAESAEEQMIPDVLEVVVSKSGSYSVNGKGLVNNQSETLKRALKEIAGDNTDTALVITADADATHQSVITAMDAAGQVGLTHISITTRRTGDIDAEESQEKPKPKSKPKSSK